jgi:hypothetical protein
MIKGPELMHRHGHVYGTRLYRLSVRRASTWRIRRQFPAVALEILGNLTLGLMQSSFYESVEE